MERIKWIGILFLVNFTFISASHAEAPEARKAKEIVGKMAVLQAITEGDIRQFDKELESRDFDLYSSPSYQRLLAARSVLEGLEEQVEVYAENEKFSKAVVEILSQTTGQKNLDQTLKAEGLIPTLRDASKLHWDSLVTQAQFRMSSPALASLKQDVKVELASIRSSINRNLLHFVGVNGFRNINGSGFRDGTWALTYDDGPHPSRTGAILSLLRQYGYSATFFVLAKNAKAYTSVTRSILSNGMEVANHSYNHPNMAKLGYNSLSRQIFSSSDTIESITGRALRYFRLPYGSGQNKSSIQKMLAQRGLIHVAWNVDSLDWRDKNPQSIYNRVVKQMRARGGGVILFHDIHSQTIRASEILMREMRAGRVPGRLMSVSEAL